MEINIRVKLATSSKESATGTYSMLPPNEKNEKKSNISKTILS